jgi:hypothetical protein
MGAPRSAAAISCHRRLVGLTAASSRSELNPAEKLRCHVSLDLRQRLGRGIMTVRGVLDLRPFALGDGAHLSRFIDPRHVFKQHRWRGDVGR